MFHVEHAFTHFVIVPRGTSLADQIEHEVLHLSHAGSSPDNVSCIPSGGVVCVHHGVAVIAQSIHVRIQQHLRGEGLAIPDMCNGHSNSAESMIASAI